VIVRLVREEDVEVLGEGFLPTFTVYLTEEEDEEAGTLDAGRLAGRLTPGMDDSGTLKHTFRAREFNPPELWPDDQRAILHACDGEDPVGRLQRYYLELEKAKRKG